MGGANSRPLPDGNTYVVHVGQNLDRFPYKVRPDHPVVFINLQRNRIVSLPKNLANLKTLLLSDNKYTELPRDVAAAIASYPNLQVLDLQRNELKEFPLKLSSLKNLVISKNFLTKLPSLVNMSEIDVSFNQISIIDQTSAFIEKLIIKHNCVTQILPQLSFQKLTFLDLQMNGIESIPNIAERFPNLSVINLSYNKLKSIDGFPPNAKDVNLTFNELTELPPFNDKLELLSISGNKIKKIGKLPIMFKKILADMNEIEEVEEADVPNLEYANLMGNNLKALPSFLNRKHMPYILMSGNKISEIPNSWLMASIEQIHISHNNLSKLPDELFKLPRLRILVIDNNQIAEFPESFTSSKITHINFSFNPLIKMPNLPPSIESVDAGFCGITEITPLCFANCTTLWALNMAGNKLKNFNVKVPAVRLYLSANQIEKFPDVADKIRVLDLSYNQISEIPHLNFQEMRQLDLSWNKVTWVPEIKMPHIDSLKFAGNPLESGISLAGIGRMDVVDVSFTKPLVTKPDGIREYCGPGQSSKLFVCDHSAYAETQGDRDEMEDAIIVRDDMQLYAVFDGHGGSGVSTYAAHYFTNEVNDDQKRRSQDGIKSILKELEDKITAKRLDDGATMVLCTMTGKHGIITHLGDSRLLIVQKDGSIRYVTTDHKPTDRAEFERINKEGGLVSLGRTAGVLAVARAIGDHSVEGVSHTPEFQEFDVEEDDKYLVLACDGVFDALNNDVVGRMAAESGDRWEAAYRIREASLSCGSLDNVSVVVVDVTTL